MKRTTKIIAGTLCLVMLLIPFAACSDEPSGEAGNASETNTAVNTPGASATARATDAEPTEKPMYPIADEPVTLSVWYTSSPDVLNNLGSVANHEVLKAGNAIIGVDLEVIDISMLAAKEQFSIMAASDDYTDMINTNAAFYTSGVSGAHNEGLIIDLAEYLPEYAPDYWQIISDRGYTRNISTDNGEMLSFYILQDNYIPSEGLAIRQDLLDELGMEVPETYDEFYDVLTAFKNVYDLTDPLWYQHSASGQGLNSNSATVLIGGYGVNWAFYNADGVIKYGPLESGFYEYIKMVAAWYDEGLVNVDFYSRPENPQDSANQAILLDGQQGVHRADMAELTNLPQQQITGRDNYRLVAMKDLTIDGTPHHLGNAPSGVATNQRALTITTACENIEAAVKWANFWYTEEGSTLSNYGLENVTFEYGADSTPAYTDLIANNENMSYGIARQTYLLFTQVPNLYDMKNAYSIYNQDSKDAGDIWLSGMDSAWILPESLSYTESESSDLSLLLSDIETYNSEIILSFIIGEKALNETSWAEYQERLLSMDIERCIEIYQGSLNRYLAR